VISINIHNDFNKKLTLNENAIKNLCKKVVKNEGCLSADIDLILTDRKFLNSLKKKYLKMDVFTDVMAFNLGDNKNIDGEVYVSIDDVLENSKLFSKTFNDEFSRIFIVSSTASLLDPFFSKILYPALIASSSLSL